MAADEKDLKHISRFLALILRHSPETIGLSVDPQGWGSIDFILQNAPHDLAPVTREIIDQVVLQNDKARYAISPDGQYIRALQGHSIAVDLQLKPATPPKALYHGTVERFMPSIMERGLLPRSRQHVHLSVDAETAQRVAGRRKGMTVLLSVDCKSMLADGYSFYLSENRVWLTDEVPSRYLNEVTPKHSLCTPGAPS